MKTDFISFLSGILGVGIITCLFPNRQKISGALKLVTSLLILGSLAGPLQSLIGSLSFPSTDHWLQDKESGFNYEEEWNDSFQNATGSYLEELLCGYLQNRYDISEGELSCSVRMHEDGTPEKIFLILSGKAIWKDPSPMEKEVSELFGCPCESLIA